MLRVKCLPPSRGAPISLCNCNQNVPTGKKTTFDYWIENKVHPHSPHWKKKLKTLEKKIRICTLNILCSWNFLFVHISRFGNLNMQFACVLALNPLFAPCSQHLGASICLYYAGDYLQYFAVFATYCLELVLGSISDWFRVYLVIISGWF
jgi:hypothetical protein